MEDRGHDPRSTPELFEASLQRDDDVAWPAIQALHWRGSKEVLDRAVGLTCSDEALMRMRGADILGQLGVPERTFPEECFQAVVLLLKDSEITVLDAAISALGHIDRDRASVYIASFETHVDDRIRLTVAMSLSGAETQDALEALRRLTNDPDDVVRDWATFGIGRQSKVDTAPIRDALALRLDDHDEVVRYEATCGLALKRDRRALSSVITMLEANPEDFDLRRAAAAMLDDEEARETAVSELLNRLRAV